MYDALGGEFEEKLLKVALNFVNQELNSPVDYSKQIADALEFQLPDQSSTTSDYHTSENYSTIVSITVCEAQSRHLCRAFTLMFYGLQNIFRKESRYFLQYLNKFPFMVIVSNFKEITPPPTNLKVPNLWSDFSVSNSVRSNFLNRPPHKILISTMSFILQN